MGNDYTATNFIKKAKEVHKKKNKSYGYEEVKYTNSKADVIINCPKHGKFLQRASHHTEGKGCYICGGGGRLFEQEVVIQQFKDKHGDLYDYSEVEYVNASSKVKIICKKHKLHFTQAASEHKRGRGCPMCKNRMPNDSRTVIDLLQERWGYRFKVIGNVPLKAGLKTVIKVVDLESTDNCQYETTVNNILLSH